MEKCSEANACLGIVGSAASLMSIHFRQIKDERIPPSKKRTGNYCVRQGPVGSALDVEQGGGRPQMTVYGLENLLCP